jgi:hypothetical protein
MRSGSASGKLHHALDARSDNYNWKTSTFYDADLKCNVTIVTF